MKPELISSEAYESVLRMYRPALVPLEHNLFAAVFSLMKLFPAERCLRRAREEGRVQAQSALVETSSGNMALGLALISKLLNYQLTIVTDYCSDGFLRRRLEDLGTRVEIVPAPAAQGGFQRARLSRVEQLRRENPDCFWINQYENPANPGSYDFLARELTQSLGRVDCLVASVGSGGSACGTALALRELFPHMRALAVDTFGSVLFGLPDAPRELRGLGNSVLPRNLDHQTFDEIHWVSAAEAYKATRMLHRSTALFCGGTSGASWLVARHWARTHPDDRVVCLFPDDGYRYTETIYNDSYLREKGLWLSELPRSPREVVHPGEVAPGWSFMRWQRRTYADVMGAVCSAP